MSVQRSCDAELKRPVAQGGLGKRQVWPCSNPAATCIRRGAHTGDVFMGLIYTCQLCGASAFTTENQIVHCS